MVAGGQIQNFSQLLSTNEVFVVPDFQRNYSWEIKQVDDLFDDINKTAQLQDSHFLGSLILLRNKSTNGIAPVEIVDGQQRLTTLFLLIAAIRDVAVSLPLTQISLSANAFPVNPSFDANSLLFIQNEGVVEPRFVAHPMIQGMVASSVFAHPSDDRPKLPKSHLKQTLAMRRAFARLLSLVSEVTKNQVDDESKVKYLNRLLETVKYKLKVLNVSSDTNSEAYEIFMTLNSRGMPLGPSDLVKSEIFKHLTKDLSGKDLEIKNSSLSSDWQFIVNNLEEGDIDQFLRHFLVSTIPGALTSKKIFERIDQMVNKSGKDPIDASQSLLNELMHGSTLYKYLLANDSPDFTGEEDSLTLLQELTDSYRIFCLAVIDPRIKLEDVQRVELIRLCEVVVVRWVLTGQNAQDLENLMQDLSIELRNGVGYDSIRAKFKAKVTDDEKVARTFEDTVENASIVRVVLHRINRRWDANGLIALNNQAIHVEHIAPATPTDHWKQILFPNDEGIERDVEYEAAVELWGNKTILDAKINQEIKQKPFEEKRIGLSQILKNGKIKHYKGYTDSPLKVTEDLGKNFEYWSRNLIAERSSWIADCFLKIWTVEPDIDSIKHFSDWRRSL